MPGLLCSCWTLSLACPIWSMASWITSPTRVWPDDFSVQIAGSKLPGFVIPFLGVAFLLMSLRPAIRYLRKVSHVMQVPVLKRKMFFFHWERQRYADCNCQKFYWQIRREAHRQVYKNIGSGKYHPREVYFRALYFTSRRKQLHVSRLTSVTISKHPCK